MNLVLLKNPVLRGDLWLADVFAELPRNWFVLAGAFGRAFCLQVIPACAAAVASVGWPQSGLQPRRCLLNAPCGAFLGGGHRRSSLIGPPQDES